jgi:hypothetical protein
MEKTLEINASLSQLAILAFFFCRGEEVGLGLNSGLHACKASILPFYFDNAVVKFQGQN